MSGASPTKPSVYGGRTTPGVRGATSFMIGTDLAAGKRQRYLARKRKRAAGGAMVHPDWIHACIARNTLVPVHDYLVVTDESARTIADCFAHATAGECEG